MKFDKFQVLRGFLGTSELSTQVENPIKNPIENPLRSILEFLGQ